MIAELTDSSFDEVVLTSSRPVVVDYRARWCLPCRLVEPVLAELDEELAGGVRFVQVDCDLNPGLVARFGIVSMPTIQLWRDGELAGVVFGARPKAALREEILSALL